MKRLSCPDDTSAEAARLGGQLRDARIMLGVSLEDVAAALRIRRVYLEALENGRLQELPAPAYVLGFVRSYARALGLDADDMVRRYREAAAGATLRKPELIFPEPVPERGIPAGAVMLAGAVLVIGAYAAWYQWSGSNTRTVDAVPPMPARLERLTAREAARPTIDFIPPSPMADESGAVPIPALSALSPDVRMPSPPGPSAASAATVPTMPNPTSISPTAATPAQAPPRVEEARIQLRAKADTWVSLRDRTANHVLVSRVLKPGETLPVPPRPGLVVTIGNAPGLDFLVDGEPTPPLPGTPLVRRDVPLEADRLKAGNFSPLPVPITSADASPAGASRSPARASAQPGEPAAAR
jgi:cytoskeleton protein RodZ